MKPGRVFRYARVADDPGPLIRGVDRFGLAGVRPIRNGDAVKNRYALHEPNFDDDLRIKLVPQCPGALSRLEAGVDYRPRLLSGGSG